MQLETNSIPVVKPENPSENKHIIYSFCFFFPMWISIKTSFSLEHTPTQRYMKLVNVQALMTWAVLYIFLSCVFHENVSPAIYSRVFRRLQGNELGGKGKCLFGKVQLQKLKYQRFQLFSPVLPVFREECFVNRWQTEVHHINKCQNGFKI